MSIISTAYDALVDRVETVLDTANQGYRRIPNPYVVEDNNDLNLKKGYGVAILPGENTNRVVNCKFSISRTIEVVLSRLYTGDDENASTRATTEKLLFEDQYKLINNFEQDLTINGSTMYTKWVSDGGIEYLSGDSGRFFLLKTQFSLEYLESFV